MALPLTPGAVEVLNHGYVKLVDKMGDDTSIIADARMSTGGEFRGWETDEKLLRYLWANKHTSPFEGVEFKFEVKAPIFVARQWMRHRTFSYNELSARYTQLPMEFYVPSTWRLQDVKNKQASVALADDWDLGDVADGYDDIVDHASEVYELMIERGVGRELARLVLPVSTYTVFRAKGNLHNWLHFLRLRLDQHAQYEIRVYAEEIAKMIAEICPRTMALFNESLNAPQK